MTTVNANMIQENILKGLKSSDPQLVIETIAELRVSGNVAYIPLLLVLLNSTQNPEIKKSISELFSNLKDNDAIPFIISAIQDSNYSQDIKRLVSSCWENGLDYSKYISLFVDLLIENNLEVAFEAYTVIMNTENKIDQAIIDLEIERLEKVLPSISDEKRPLLLDVIDFLPSVGF
jgi:HEAT repeat protein